MLVFAVAALLIAPAASGAEPAEVELEGDVRLEGGSPDMICHGDRYYIFTGGEGITIRRSDDTVKWEVIGTVFPGVPQWAEDKAGGTLWAPDISYFAGKYHLYYAASTRGSNNSAIGLATNTTLDPEDPNYEWKDHGRVLESQPNDDFNAIDANLVLDAHDGPWLVYGSYWSGIQLRKLDLATGKLSSEDTEVHRLARRTFYRHGSRAVEAPYIVRKGDFYYLFVSFEPQTRDYHVRVGRSKSLTGPYHDFQGRDLMEGGGTLVLYPYDHVISSGHNGVFLGPDGSDWFVYHYWDRRADEVRTLGLRRLVWVDGWPVVGEPHSRRALEPRRRELTQGLWQYTIGFNQPWRRMGFRRDGIVRMFREEGKWQREGSELTLRWLEASAGAEPWVDELVLSDCGQWFVGLNADGKVVRGRRLK